MMFCSTGSEWTPAHDKAVEAFKRRGATDLEIKDVLADIRGDLNAFHTHRDAEFSLLFHASIEGSIPAVKVGRLLSQTSEYLDSCTGFN